MRYYVLRAQRDGRKDRTRIQGEYVHDGDEQIIVLIQKADGLRNVESLIQTRLYQI